MDRKSGKWGGARVSLRQNIGYPSLCGIGFTHLVHSKSFQIVINGTSNHIHIFAGYKPHQSISDLLQDIKGDSSKWINENRFVYGKFQWQKGYGAFSYSHSPIDHVVKYIKNQEKHHKLRSFKEEYLDFLKKYLLFL
ncbi:MAG: transposase [Clostridiaceae bacterium]|nr:transposase [Clostridiaceae bacterium]